MKSGQSVWRREQGWIPKLEMEQDSADLVLIFGASRALADERALPELRSRYPRALFVGCSTAGEIQDIYVRDDTIVATAVSFESTKLRGHKVVIASAGDSRQAGQALAEALLGEDLVNILVLSDGLNVNGSEVVAGITAHLPEHVTVTGGLAGDGEGIGSTSVLHAEPSEASEGSLDAGSWLDQSLGEHKIVGVGFYGDRLQVACGSLAGWDPFGPERRITRSKGNVLYELDGQSALALYKKFLGEKAAELPTSGLLFPLSLRSPDGSTAGIVRTVLAVDEESQSMTFAGDLEEGWYAQLMKANFERLIDGAMGAARTCIEDAKDQDPDFALLVSCVGRKLVLKQRVEEEVEAVREVLGDKVVLSGFYSLGEISPFSTSGQCELHNQTMTITTFSET